MSLRAEIHDAIDEVAPTAPMLASRIVAFVAKEDRLRPASLGRRRWSVRFRSATSMVAAVLVVVLMATLVVGGRLWRGWSDFQTEQATKAELAKLEASPLILRPVSPGTMCPTGPLAELPPDSPGTGASMHGGTQADGGNPVYVGPGYSYRTNWGTWIETYYRIPPGFSGPILIRAKDLVTNQPIAFAQFPFDLVNTPIAHLTTADGRPTGDLVKQDVVQGKTVQGRTELVIDASMFTAAAKKGDYLGGMFLSGYENGGSGCLGYQVDGPGFTETFTMAY